MLNAWISWCGIHLLTFWKHCGINLNLQRWKTEYSEQRLLAKQVLLIWRWYFANGAPVASTWTKCLYCKIHIALISGVWTGSTFILQHYGNCLVCVDICMLLLGLGVWILWQNAQMGLP